MFKNVQQTEEALMSLADALMNYTPEKLVNHFAAEHSRIKGEDPLIKFLLKRIQGPKEEDRALNKVDIEILKEIYFGRFQKTANRFFKLIENKKTSELPTFISNIAMQYIHQHIIDRRQFNIMSRNANLIIGLAKHAGADIDTTKFSRAYYKKIRTQAAQNGIRQISISEDDHDLIVSMGMERDRFTKDEIKIYNNEFRKAYKSLFPNYKPPQVADHYNSNNIQSAKSVATKNLNSLIEDTAKVELLGTAYIPEEIYNQVERYFKYL